jgi:hypothetical protein
VKSFIWLRCFIFIFILSVSSCKSNAQPLWENSSGLGLENIEKKEFLSHLKYIIHFLETYPNQFSNQLSEEQRIGMINAYKGLLKSKNKNDLLQQLKNYFNCFQASKGCICDGLLQSCF